MNYYLEILDLNLFKLLKTVAEKNQIPFYYCLEKLDKNPFGAYILLENQLESYSLNNLHLLENIKEMVIIFTDYQNENSKYIIEKILQWRKISLNILKHNKNYPLPKFIFNGFIQLNYKIIKISKSEDLFLHPPKDWDYFIENKNWAKHLNSSDQDTKIFYPDKLSLKSMTSICSITKIMQYFALRTIMDLPND